MATETVQGRGSAPHGHADSNSRGSKSDCLKWGASVQNPLFLLLLSSLSNSRKDDQEAGPLDSRLNIGWDKLSRWIKDFVNAVTQNQHQIAPGSNTASPVTSRNSSGDSQSNTWKWDKATACLNQHKSKYYKQSLYF